MSSQRMLAALIVVVAVGLTALGGLLDVQETHTFTRDHLWHDGMFLLGLALVLLFFEKE
jgi:hypothetical protein